jgi:hypothetical protein
LGGVSAKQADGWLQHYRDDFIALASLRQDSFLDMEPIFRLLENCVVSTAPRNVDVLYTDISVQTTRPPARFGNLRFGRYWFRRRDA